LEALAREDGHADPPAAEWEALAEPPKDHSALRVVLRDRNVGDAAERGQRVDLVTQHHKLVLPGEVSERLDLLRARHRTGRVLRAIRDKHLGVPPALPRFLDAGFEHIQLKLEVRLGSRRDEGDRFAKDVRLRCVGHPRRLGQDDFLTQRHQTREDERFAARPDHHLFRRDVEVEPPGVVHRYRLPQLSNPQGLCVAPLVRVGTECLGDLRMHGEARLAEGQVIDVLTRRPHVADPVVDGDRGRCLEPANPGSRETDRFETFGHLRLCLPHVSLSGMWRGRIQIVGHYKCPCSIDQACTPVPDDYLTSPTASAL